MAYLFIWSLIGIYLNYLTNIADNMIDLAITLNKIKILKIIKTKTNLNKKN